MKIHEKLVNFRENSLSFVNSSRKIEMWERFWPVGTVVGKGPTAKTQTYCRYERRGPRERAGACRGAAGGSEIFVMKICRIFVKLMNNCAGGDRGPGHDPGPDPAGADANRRQHGPAFFERF